MPRLITRATAAFGVVLALSACTDPYDPGQRALGGGAIGAGAGAAIGGLAGGWHGAAIGALAGGAVGAVGGAVTTPRPPPPRIIRRPHRPAIRRATEPASARTPLLVVQGCPTPGWGEAIRNAYSAGGFPACNQLQMPAALAAGHTACLLSVDRW